MEDGPVYMTQEEGFELAQMGLILPDASRTSPINPNAVLVNITDYGKEKLAEMSVPTPPAPVVQHVEEKVESGFAITSDVPVPKVMRDPSKSKPRKCKYPFDQLEVGQSFHLPVTEEKPEPWKVLAPFVTAANTRSKEPVVPEETVMVKRKRIVLDENGNKVKEDGKLVYERFEVEELKLVQTKKFICRKVDSDDPDGEGARVFRVSLEHQD